LTQPLVAEAWPITAWPGASFPVAAAD
jgi:hypothetical protein